MGGTVQIEAVGNNYETTPLTSLQNKTTYHSMFF